MGLGALSFVRDIFESNALTIGFRFQAEQKSVQKVGRATAPAVSKSGLGVTKTGALLVQLAIQF